MKKTKAYICPNCNSSFTDVNGICPECGMNCSTEKEVVEQIHESKRSLKEKRIERKARKSEEKARREMSRQESPETRKKKFHITSTQAFNPILGVKDGVIVTKNEQYIKLMEFSPINFELRAPYEQSEIIAGFASAIRTMPDLVHLKIINAPVDISPFTTELKRLSLSESSAGCRALQEDQIKLISMVGRTQSVSRRFFLSFKYEKEGTLARKPDFSTVAKNLKRTELSIAASMEACGNTEISNDSSEYLRNTLYTIMCRGESDKTDYAETKSKIVAKYENAYHHSIDPERIPPSDFIAPERLDFSLSPTFALIDSKYVMYCCIPSESYPVQAAGGWMQVLYSAFDGIDIDMWIEKQDAAKMQNRITFELKNNRILQRNTDDSAKDYEDIENALSAGYFMKSAISEGDDICYISTLVTLYADSPGELAAKYKAVAEHYRRNDLQLMKCWFQQEDAYLATLPLADYDPSLFAKTKRNITGSHLGSCYPFTANELNDKNGIFFGINPRYGSPIFLNIFDRYKYQNANMMIFGPSGSGKSYTLMTMLLRMRQKGLQIYVIAPFKGSEFARACHAINGEYVKICAGSPQNINIMEIRRHEDSSAIIDTEIYQEKSFLAAKIQQVTTFITLVMKNTITPEETSILNEALMKTYERFGMTTDNASLEDPDIPGQYKKMPVLSDLYETLAGFGDITTRMRRSLKVYVDGSASSFNRQTNVNLNNKYIVLDVSEATEDDLPIGMFIALDFVLDAAKADKTQNKVIAIDELWRLMKASELTAGFAVEVFKIIRGYGGSAIGATQDIADVMNDKKYGAAIINNAKIKFFLKTDLKKEIDVIRSTVDITDREADQLLSSKMGKTASDRQMLMIAGGIHVFTLIKTSDKEHDLITTNTDELAYQKKIRIREMQKTESKGVEPDGVS